MPSLQHLARVELIAVATFLLRTIGRRQEAVAYPLGPHVGAAMVFVLVVLAAVVAAIKQEPPTEQLTSQPPKVVTA